jgi:mycothiol system anti-sigma-R factor
MKKKCLDAERRLYEYLDGEMGRIKRWRLKRHLKACPPCEDGYSFESKLKRKIHDGCAEEVPEELWNRISTFIRHNGVTDASAEPNAGGSDV